MKDKKIGGCIYCTSPRGSKKDGMCPECRDKLPLVKDIKKRLDVAAEEVERKRVIRERQMRYMW